jgi:hypothetical protein
MERTVEQRVNVNFCVKMKKSATGRTPVHGVYIEEFPQPKEAMGVKAQDQNNVDLLFRHQRYLAL